jgi:hypothetical protein
MIKFNRINGWSYKTSDNAYMISNCGNRTWFSAQIDAELSAKHGFEVAVENTKMYHTTLAEAQNWVRSYNYVAVSA